MIAIQKITDLVIENIFVISPQLWHKPCPLGFKSNAPIVQHTNSP